MLADEKSEMGRQSAEGERGGRAWRESDVTSASDEAVKPQDRSGVYVLPTYPCQFAYFSQQKVRYLVFLLDNLAPKRIADFYRCGELSEPISKAWC